MRQGLLDGVVERTINEFVEGVVATLPTLVTGLVFLVLAWVLVRLVRAVARAFLRRTSPGEDVYVQFVETTLAVVLWFGVALSLLSIVGLDGIAASLGTASGFVALGVAYALSGMIADAVAGVYLLRDPDFNPGDTVVAGDVTGEVAAIELRKTRLEVEGDTVVRANADIERSWTKKSG